MSGVYIPAEMPKSCGNCFFDTRCDNWRLRNWGAPPPDDCPLVPVLEHGRLIAAFDARTDVGIRSRFIGLLPRRISQTRKANRMIREATQEYIKLRAADKEEDK